MIDLNYISYRIKQARTDAGFSQLFVAEKLNVRRETVASWESGKNKPSIQCLAELADIFSCDIDYLLGLCKEKHRIAADVKSITGLSESATIWLQSKRAEYPHFVSALNEIFEYEGIAELFLSSIYNYALSHFTHVTISDSLSDKETKMSLEESQRMLKFNAQECYSHVLDVIRENNHATASLLAGIKISGLKRSLAAQAEENNKLLGENAKQK